MENPPSIENDKVDNPVTETDSADELNWTINPEKEIETETKEVDPKANESDIVKEQSDTVDNDIQQNDENASLENGQVTQVVTEVIDKINKENENQTNVQTKVTVNIDETESKSIVNPLKRKRSRPPKRKRKQKINRISSNPPEVASDLSIDTSIEESKEDVEYCLTVSNLPNKWSFMDIKNYIDTECGPVDEIEMIKDDKTNKGAIRLSYQTHEECKEALEKLKDKEIEGNKLVFEITVLSLESDSEPQSETSDSTKPWRPDLDSWEVDMQGMYGLKLQYLRSLGITPPLDKWVHVSNFRCDKSELRDVMEMAGNVQMCSIFSGSVTHRYANVMYSHPLEAVQAVSMLNNQLFYGQQLKVKMERSPDNTVLLPKGLTGVGKGLGLNGKPLRNIVKHYERFVENKDCMMDPTVFDIPHGHSMKLSSGYDTKFEVKSVEDIFPPGTEPESKETVKSVAPSKPTPTPTPTPTPIPAPTPPKPLRVQTPAYTLAAPPPARAPSTPIQRPFNNITQGVFAHNGAGQPMQHGVPGPIGPPMPLMQVPPRPQPHPGLAGPPRPPNQLVPPYAANAVRPGWGGPGPLMNGHPGPMGPPRPMGNPRPMGPMGPMGPPRPMGPMFNNEPVKLMLSNLPPSTTFALLCEKMSEWGHVVCIQLTTPGCAVVTFANRMQADACFQHFHGRNIENHFIHVKYA